MKDRRRASRECMAWTLAFGQPEDRTPTHWLRGDARGRDGGVRQGRPESEKAWTGRLAARFRTIQVCPKDLRAASGAC
jgi:hypothetical protein